MTNHSGFGGAATINGTEIPITSWTVNADIRFASTDNSLSGGFELAEASGGKKATFTINTDYDFDQSVFGAPLSVVIGTTLTNVKLFLRGTSGAFFLFPSALVTGTPMTVDHSGTGMISVQISGRNNGTFSYPGGITP